MKSTPKSTPLIKSSKEIILLLLYAKGKTNSLYEPIDGRTRLMKMVFLFKEELKSFFNNKSILSPSSLPDFSAYDFGPFSYEVLNDIEFLKTNEFISVKTLEEEPIPEEIFEYNQWENEVNIKLENETYIPEEYSLSDLGIEFTETKLIAELTTEQMNVLNEFKKRCTEVSLRTLLKYVYKNYPSMITKSKIRDEVLKEYY